MDTGTHNKQLQHGGDLSANSRTLMISGIPSTYCTKEFLLRHFQVHLILHVHKFSHETSHNDTLFLINIRN